MTKIKKYVKTQRTNLKKNFPQFTQNDIIFPKNIKKTCTKTTSFWCMPALPSSYF